MASAAKKVSARAKQKSSRGAAASAVKRPAAAAKRQYNPSAYGNASATAAAKNMQETADNFVKMSAEMMRGMFQSKEGMKAAQGSEQMAKSADFAARSLNEAFAIGKDQMEACVQSSNIAVNASKSMSAEWINYANKAFSQNVDISKEVFNCRTLNDMFDLHSKMMKATLDNFFNESVKMSEMFFKCAADVAEPLSEQVSETAERISKTLAA